MEKAHVLEQQIVRMTLMVNIILSVTMEIIE